MNESLYFERRAAQEAAAAARAKCPKAEAAHRIIAERYAAIARELAIAERIERCASDRTSAPDSAAA
ncbi:hypothetical protein [Sphingomonas mesophila]|uniref:hypothetical protein n=1 Tax=Sphingomonas mesophila TaxID=2303576 RepID=UPI000E574864|nr:hypothetical protein [Sphingomonas mesophila]